MGQSLIDGLSPAQTSTLTPAHRREEQQAQWAQYMIQQRLNGLEATQNAQIDRQTALEVTAQNLIQSLGIAIK